MLLGSGSDVGVPGIHGKYCVVDRESKNRSQPSGSDQIIPAGTRHQIISLSSFPKFLTTNGPAASQPSWMGEFAEGRICALWVEMQAQEIHTRGLQKRADSWVRGLMRRLLKLTHRQWLHCSAKQSTRR
jgi:hypothetical protein